MLEFLRKSTGGWIVKLLIGLIIMAFAAFGVNDMISTKQNTTLATVGDITISSNSFKQIFERQKTALSRRIRQPITNAQARAFRIDQNVLNYMVSGAAIDSHAKKLGLTISEDQVKQSIFSSPMFKDPSGNFNKVSFFRFLSDNGYSEQTFLAEERIGKIRNQLTETMTGMVHIPAILSETAYNHDHEQRTLKYFTLSEKRIAKIAAPKDDVLKTYYAAHIKKYKAPEYRKVSYINLSIDTLKKTTKVDPANIKAAYEKNKDSFGEPEKRHVLQLLFPDMKAAEEARKSLKTEADFLALAKKRKVSKEDMDLGFTTLKSMVDPKVAKATFALKKGVISPATQGEFVTTLVFVKDIKKAVTKTFKDVEQKIKEGLVLEQAKIQASKLLTAIEKERSTGKGLADIAKDLKIPFNANIVSDIEGNDQAGKKIPDIDPSLLNQAFQTDVGQQTEPVELGRDSVAWFNVSDIILSKNKDLKDVKKTVVKDWMENEKLQAVNKLSAEILKEIQGGKTLQQMAKKYKAKVQTTKPLKRSDKDDKLAPSLLAQAFMLEKNFPSAATSKNGKERVLFEVSDIISPTKKDEKEVAKIQKALVSVFQQDYLAGYFKSLKNTYKVSIDTSVLNKIVMKN